MKKIWRRALGMLKDKNSLWITKMVRRSQRRNPCLEAAIIKATNHDDTSVDYKNAQRVFTWVRASPSFLMIFLRTLTRRVKRTKDWSVALKCLILLHGVLCTKAPGTRRIGHLPFDLSTFEDAFTLNDFAQLHPLNAFIQAYFAFSNAKSMVMAIELKEETQIARGEEYKEVKLKLVRVQRWQNLMDDVLQVKPHGNGMVNEVLVIEVMDCMIIEVFEVYSKICDGIAKALMMIYTDNVDIEEATLALDVLRKATKQGQELSKYFEFCKRIGILYATECPKIEQIPDEDFVELERIINGGGVTSSKTTMAYPKERMTGIDIKENNKLLKTVITDKWEVFDEDIIKLENENENKNGNVYRNGNEIGNEWAIIDPFASSYNFQPLIQFNPFVDYGGVHSQPIGYFETSSYISIYVVHQSQ
ncbi:hypothetical protein Cgig2_008399 [Carnegiea gigantea]|uniref:ENTH domain-containing protein n=1 Tax=Carnegiea gigantea TaxID=171969 RepID=A0A9Q1KGW3_9CARY|nr:hypothetical protein Cgig2_008399 [Carnegiea gigantea]